MNISNLNGFAGPLAPHTPVQHPQQQQQQHPQLTLVQNSSSPLFNGGVHPDIGRQYSPFSAPLFYGTPAHSFYTHMPTPVPPTPSPAPRFATPQEEQQVNIYLTDEEGRRRSPRRPNSQDKADVPGGTKRKRTSKSLSYLSMYASVYMHSNLL